MLRCNNGGHGMGSATFFDLVKDKIIDGFDTVIWSTSPTSSNWERIEQKHPGPAARGFAMPTPAEQNSSLD
jgi:hypothetical protein